MATFTFNTAGGILFGEGVLGQIGAIATARLGRRALIVTDRGVLEAGLVEPALEALAAAGVEATVYSDV